MPERQVAILGDVVVQTGAVFDGTKPRAPEFETVPVMSVAVERSNQKVRAFQPTMTRTLDASTAQGRVSYRGNIRLADAGAYRLSFCLKGNTREGPFVMDSPTVGLRVVSLRPYIWLGGGIVVLALLGWVSSATARLRGRLEVASAKGQRGDLRLPAVKLFRTGTDLCGIALGGLRFELCASRLLFLRPRVVLVVPEGRMTVSEMKKDRAAGGVQLGTGARKKPVQGRRYQLRFMTNAGADVTVVADIRR